MTGAGLGVGLGPALALVTPRKLWRLFDGFDWSIVWAQRSNLLRGVGLLAWVALASMVLSVVVGALVASARRSQVKPVRWLAWAYIQLFRGISLYVLVIWMFFGLAAAAQWRLPAATAGIVALTLLHSAYLAEAFRAALAVIPSGQHEAAGKARCDPAKQWNGSEHDDEHDGEEAPNIVAADRNAHLIAHRADDVIRGK